MGWLRGEASGLTERQCLPSSDHGFYDGVGWGLQQQALVPVGVQGEGPVHNATVTCGARAGPATHGGRNRLDPLGSRRGRGKGRRRRRSWKRRKRRRRRWKWRRRRRRGKRNSRRGG